ncbi:MAG: sulfite exporter TauE/SafE family protein, partial [Anaerolineae bacterium]|nr:sulfite exporter TauE/SafE family protein [Anaerolineae bacterium]
MTLDYWFMFPAAVLIATIAMASGVGGATFFSPLLILALGLPPEVAIGTGLITEVFGFASGLYAY